jgi:hypothetical protein
MTIQKSVTGDIIGFLSLAFSITVQHPKTSEEPCWVQERESPSAQAPGPGREDARTGCWPWWRWHDGSGETPASSSVNLAVLSKVWSLDQQQPPLGTCNSCKLSGPTQDWLKEKPWELWPHRGCFNSSSSLHYEMQNWGPSHHSVRTSLVATCLAQRTNGDTDWKYTHCPAFVFSRI